MLDPDPDHDDQFDEVDVSQINDESESTELNERYGSA